jgi:hypothetical protein
MNDVKVRIWKEPVVVNFKELFWYSPVEYEENPWKNSDPE